MSRDGGHEGGDRYRRVANVGYPLGWESVLIKLHKSSKRVGSPNDSFAPSQKLNDDQKLELVDRIIRPRHDTRLSSTTMVSMIASCSYIQRLSPPAITAPTIGASQNSQSCPR